MRRRTSLIKWETIEDDDHIAVVAHLAQLHQGKLHVTTFGGYVGLNGQSLTDGQRRLVISDLTTKTREQLTHWKQQRRHRKEHTMSDTPDPTPQPAEPTPPPQPDPNQPELPTEPDDQ